MRYYANQRRILDPRSGGFIAMIAANEILSWKCQTTGYLLIINDDGRTCYAYLHQPDYIVVGDVWLYNRFVATGQSGLTVPKRGEAIPIEVEFIDESVDLTELAKNNITAVFSDENSERIEARIFSNDTLAAIICEGSCPGWTITVKKTCPWGIRLDEYPASPFGLRN